MTVVPGVELEMIDDSLWLIVITNYIFVVAVVVIAWILVSVVLFFMCVYVVSPLFPIALILGVYCEIIVKVMHVYIFCIYICTSYTYIARLGEWSHVFFSCPVILWYAPLTLDVSTIIDFC